MHAVCGVQTGQPPEITYWFEAIAHCRWGAPDEGRMRREGEAETAAERRRGVEMGKRG